MISQLFLILFCVWGVFLFHSCVPGGDQRDLLALTRASDDAIHDYKASFEVSQFFQAATKNCAHCGKLVESNISSGECMFSEVIDMSPDMPDYRKKVQDLMRQLRGEAAHGYGPANFLLGQIREYALLGQKQDIIAAARHYRLFADTGSAPGRAALAGYWLRLGENLPAAVELLKKSIEAEPRNTGFLMALSQAYGMMGKYTESFEAAKKAYANSPVNSEERFVIETSFAVILLNVAAELGEEAALAQINDMIYFSSRNDSLKLVRAQLYAIFKKFYQAEKELTLLKDKLPENNLELARLRMDNLKGDFSAAHKRIDSLLAKEPQNFEFRSAKIQQYMQENKEKEAFETADAFIRDDKDKTRSYIMRGQMYFRKKDYKSALADFESARKNAVPAHHEEIDRLIHAVKVSMKDPLNELINLPSLE